MSRLQETIRKLRAEVAGNRRLAWGLAVIAGILVLQAFLMLLDLRAAQAREYQLQVQKLGKMKSLAGEHVWVQRAEVAARLRRALEAEIPQAETAGVAQAQVLTWVRDAAVGTAAEGLRIQPGTPEQVAAVPGVWRIPVTVAGGAPPAKAIELIRQVEQRRTLTSVAEANLLNKENKTFTLALVAYARVGTGAGDARD
ncbi:hypothetical protein MASR1M8_24870 [Thermomonas brevis]